MSQTEYTPGPWNIKKLYKEGCPAKEEYAVWHILAGKSTVCTFSFENTDIDNSTEREANAKLIAAAPELLEALQKAIEVIKQWHAADDVFDIYCSHASEMKPIWETIKKATE